MPKAGHIAILGGPTGSGKTSFSIQLAQHWACPIVNADSRQVYRELNIGVAKPSPSEFKQAEHRLFGHVSILEDYNAERYAQEAAMEVRKSLESTGRAILCGGTGLYIRALLEGLNELPEPGAETLARVDRCIREEGIVGLRKAIMKADPLAHERLDMFNPQRMQRALSLLWESGQSLNDLYLQKTLSPLHDVLENCQVEYLGLDWDRETLYHRLHQRCDSMMKDGLLEEVKGLQSHRHLNALQTVGYSEWFEHLDGTVSYPYALDKMKQNTRRYAKRQVTWFKNQFPTRWIPASTWKQDRLFLP